MRDWNVSIFICRSHSGEYKKYCLLGCDVVCYGGTYGHHLQGERVRQATSKKLVAISSTELRKKKLLCYTSFVPEIEGALLTYSTFTIFLPKLYLFTYCFISAFLIKIGLYLCTCLTMHTKMFCKREIYGFHYVVLACHNNKLSSANTLRELTYIANYERKAHYFASVYVSIPWGLAIF